MAASSGVAGSSLAAYARSRSASLSAAHCRSRPSVHSPRRIAFRRSASRCKSMSPLEQDLLHLAEQPHHVIGELGVVPVGGDHLGPLAGRLLDGDLVQLRVRVPLELRPRPAVEEQPAVLPHQVTHPGAVKDAVRRGEQAVDHVRVVVHRQREELHDAEDGQVVSTPADIPTSPTFTNPIR